MELSRIYRTLSWDQRIIAFYASRVDECWVGTSERGRRKVIFMVDAPHRSASGRSKAGHRPSTGGGRKAAPLIRSGAATLSCLHQPRAVATRRQVFVASVAFCLSILTSRYGVAEEAALWRALRSGGHVALLRHAIAPGTGDPPVFQLEDCSTQRNLSAAGRAQAERIGEQFRANGINTARVFSSQWCRCIETAKYLGLGPVEKLPVLNSFFRNRQDGDRQTKALINWLDLQDLAGVTVLESPIGDQ